MKCISIANQINFSLRILIIGSLIYCTKQQEHHGNTDCYDDDNGFNAYPIYNTNETDIMTQTPFMISMPTFSPPPSGWKCCCWQVSNQNENECRCEGDALTRVPQILKLPMQRLTIAAAGLPRLRTVGLKIYADALLDVAFINCLELELIQDGAFSNLTVLRTIYISQAPKLTFLSQNVFEGISETIEIIRIINSGLLRVPDFGHLPPYNILQMIDLDNNQISRIDSQSIKVKTAHLVLANNDISYIDDSAFLGSKIAKLSLNDNRKLKELHPNAFGGIIDITELDLSSTSLVRLPSAGLQTVEVLYMTNTHTLKMIPSIYNFKNLQKAHLTHSFHCCAFKYPSRHDPQRHAQRMQEVQKWREQCNSNRKMQKTNEIKVKKHANQIDEPSASAVVHYGRFERNMIDSFENVDEDIITDAPDIHDSYNYMADGIGYFHEEIEINPEDEQLAEYCGNFTIRNPIIECYPMPNALNPCEDVMGYQWLRIAVWIVVGLAIIGNVAVLTVILSIKTESPSVPRFLMCHLAFADLCLGLYLLFIASIDAHSMGEYFNYAFDWQYGVGCKIAGFLTVFASHLSVFTLTIITIERWLAITHAMYVNKRLRLRSAALIMLCGWLYSIAISAMPLFGISNYSSTSICLPMEIRDIYDSVYLILILGCNFLAFSIIAICYAQIYLSLGKETRNGRYNHSGDMSIAKKMALLVFTNFTCWAPIAFFGLTALAGYPLINVTESKIILVFFYPLNSCADPYLYAILTSQYRQDLFILLSKLGICRRNILKYKYSDSMPVTTQITIRASIDRTVTSKQQQQQDINMEIQQMLKNDENFV